MNVMAYAPYGAGGIIIQVEADIRRGIPGIDITRLAEGAVREAREQIRAAFRNSGFSFPQDRILINLAPADKSNHPSASRVLISRSIMRSYFSPSMPPRVTLSISRYSLPHITLYFPLLAIQSFSAFCIG
ncbi:MAG: hypothetical protein LBI06_00940 [Treponema sp.]|nr:hypothetical protein [Treponema sp.]